jgi:hypothetical protein
MCAVAILAVTILRGRAVRARGDAPCDALGTASMQEVSAVVTRLLSLRAKCIFLDSFNEGVF